MQILIQQAPTQGEGHGPTCLENGATKHFYILSLIFTLQNYDLTFSINSQTASTNYLNKKLLLQIKSKTTLKSI